MKSKYFYNSLIIFFCFALNLNQISAKIISLDIAQPSSFVSKKDGQVTQLKVTGVINKKTISTILNLYPNVVELDMLNTKIVEFTDERQVSYPANVVPMEAFNRNQKLKSVILPRGTVKIGQGAFWNCTNLENVILPNSVQVIDKFSFQLCSKLKHITLPVGLVSIGGASFAGCKSLKVIKCMNKKPPLMSEWNPFPDIEMNNCILYVPKESIEIYKELLFFKTFQIKPF